MSQRHCVSLRDEIGVNTLHVLDTAERSIASQKSLGGCPGSLLDTAMRSIASQKSLRIGDAERATADDKTVDLLPDEEHGIGVTLLSGVARDGGAQLSDPGPAPNNYRRMAVVLPILWFLIGVGNNLPGPSLQKWQVEAINVPPAGQTLLSGVIGSLPWNLKIFVAFTSDVVPIFGRRRLPYLAIGLILKAAAWFLLGAFGNHFTFALLALQQFVAIMGQMMSGVMLDTLIVENVKYEVEAGRDVGSLQTSCWMWFAIGGLIGGLLAGWMPQYFGVSYLNVFVIDGIFHFVILGVVLLFCKDPKFVKVSSMGNSVRATWDEIWASMSLIKVFKPLVFIVAFAMVPAASSAFNTYIVQASPLCSYDVLTISCDSNVRREDGTSAQGYVDFCAQPQFAAEHACDTTWGGLQFGTSLFAYMGILGSVGSVIGSFVFKRWFINANWHKLFLAVVLIASASSSLQLVLCIRDPVTGKTPNEQVHIPDSLFALGDDVVMAAANQLLSMPILILMTRLCPDNAAGTVYALVTSIQMVGGTVSGILSQICVTAFGVTNTDFSQLWQLILVTSLAKLVSVLFLPLVPAQLEDGRNGRRHWAAGAFLLACFFGGLGWAIFQIIDALVTSEF